MFSGVLQRVSWALKAVSRSCEYSLRLDPGRRANDRCDENAFSLDYILSQSEASAARSGGMEIEAI